MSLKSGHIHTACQQTSTQSWECSQVWDLVVVGAGIAGSALAFSQGQVCIVRSDAAAGIPHCH